MDLIAQVLAICGGISIIGGAGAIIWKVIHPAFRISKRIEVVERLQKNDYERLSIIESMQKQQSRALAALLNHQIDGNGVDKMKEIRDELISAVINN